MARHPSAAARTTVCGVVARRAVPFGPPLPPRSHGAPPETNEFLLEGAAGYVKLGKALRWRVGQMIFVKRIVFAQRVRPDFVHFFRTILFTEVFAIYFRFENPGTNEHSNHLKFEVFKLLYLTPSPFDLAILTHTESTLDISRF